MGQPDPSLYDVSRAMIAHIVRDLTRETGSCLRPVLDRYGVSVDLSPCAEDEGELVGVYYGERDGLAEEVSFEVLEGETEVSFFAASETPLWRADHFVPLRTYWTDPEDPARKLTAKPGKLRSLMAELAVAQAALFSREGLGARFGSWLVGNGRLIAPLYTPIVPMSRDVASIKRHMVHAYSEAELEGYVVYAD